ncbi:hypothetical protein D3C87_2042900 [compost metagenome]
MTATRSGCRAPETAAPRMATSKAGTTISQPPMVGVPALAWWDWGPSTRMLWPIFQRRR